MLLFFLTGLSFEIKRIIIAFWAFVKREIENFPRKFWGGEVRIATGAVRPRNDTSQGRCGTSPAAGWGQPALRIPRSAYMRADVGSEPSAAGGRRSEVSEWPRSKFPASAVRQRRNFGHRNRIIGPYGIDCRGGRPCPPDVGAQYFCRAGPVCPAGVRKKNPPVTASPAPFRQGADIV